MTNAMTCRQGIRRTFPLATPASLATYTLPALAVAICLSGGLANATNLLVNPSFESGNTGFSSDYTFTPIPASGTASGVTNVGEGQYRIVQNLTQAHAAWATFGSLSAQTGTNYMVANGSANTGLSPWYQTINISSGQITTSGSASPFYYRFEAYVASVYPLGFQPSLSFEMQYNDRPWQQLTTSVAPTTAYTWFLTYADGYFELAPTSLSFRLRNAVSGFEGNDFAIDSIYFGTTTQSPSYEAGSTTINGGVQIVPEPATSALALAGITCGYVTWLRRRRAAHSSPSSLTRGSAP